MKNNSNPSQPIVGEEIDLSLMLIDLIRFWKQLLLWCVFSIFFGFALSILVDSIRSLPQITYKLHVDLTTFNELSDIRRNSHFSFAKCLNADTVIISEDLEIVPPSRNGYVKASVKANSLRLLVGLNSMAKIENQIRENVDSKIVECSDALNWYISEPSKINRLIENFKELREIYLLEPEPENKAMLQAALLAKNKLIMNWESPLNHPPSIETLIDVDSFYTISERTFLFASVGLLLMGVIGIIIFGSTKRAEGL